MQKHLFLIIVIFLFIISCNNNEEYIKYHQNGHIRIRGTLDNGKKEGEWLLFSDIGDTLKKDYYFKGLIDSSITFSKDGGYKIIKYTAIDSISKHYSFEKINNKFLLTYYRDFEGDSILFCNYDSLGRLVFQRVQYLRGETISLEKSFKDGNITNCSIKKKISDTLVEYTIINCIDGKKVTSVHQVKN